MRKLLLRYINLQDIVLLKRSFQYVRRYKFKVIISLLLMVFEIVLTLTQPLIWGGAITSLFNKNFQSLIREIVYMAVLYLLQSFTNFIRTYMFSMLNENIIFDIKKDLYLKVLDLPIIAFDKMRVGEFISRMHGDTQNIANVLTSQFLNIITDILKVFIIGIFIFNINVTLASIVLLTFPVSFFVFVAYGKKIRKNKNEFFEVNDKYFSNMQQTVAGIRDVKGLGIKQLRLENFLTLTNDIKRKNVKMGIIMTLAKSIGQSINFMSQLLVISIGGYYIFLGILPIQYFIAFQSYSNQFTGSLMNITSVNSSIQEVLSALDRIFSLMDSISYSKEEFGSKILTDMEGKIEFRNIVFSYDSSKRILNKISFIIKPKKKMAIIGANGSGKSTIFHLLLKFYKPSSGRILIDGTDINDISEASLRENISIVQQEPYLFNISIKENLLLGNQNISNEDLYKVCKLAGIHEFITNLPEKYNTIIDDNSTNLSGGEKQRIAIARALLKNSKIILLDEAMSTLDNSALNVFNEVINNISRACTVVFIAHRLSSVLEADEVILIDNGKVVGVGPHELLIKENDIYKKMFEVEIKKLNIGFNNSRSKIVYGN